MMTFACVSLNLACRLVPTFPKADQPSLYLGDAYWRKAVAAFGESCRHCGHVLTARFYPGCVRFHTAWAHLRHQLCSAAVGEKEPSWSTTTNSGPLFDQLVGGGPQPFWESGPP